MFRKKINIGFVVGGSGGVFGFICGIAPGYVLRTYGRFSLILALIFFLLIFIILLSIVYQYGITNKWILLKQINIFHSNLSTDEKISLSFICLILFITGIFFGIFCELLFTAINVSFDVHLIIGSIFVFILLVSFVIILIIECRTYPQLQSSDEIPINYDPRQLLKRFYTHETVYTNNNDELAEIIEIDGVGNYRIRYLRNGLIELKNGRELRRA